MAATVRLCSANLHNITMYQVGLRALCAHSMRAASSRIWQNSQKKILNFSDYVNRFHGYNMR